MQSFFKNLHLLICFDNLSTWFLILVSYFQKKNEDNFLKFDLFNFSFFCGSLLEREKKALKMQSLFKNLHSLICLESLSTHFFYKKLSSEMSTQFLSVSSTQFLSSFLFQRDLRHSLTKMWRF